jgi:hypothetical protein
VDLEEKLEKPTVADLGGIEDNLDGFGVGSMVAVGRVRNVTSRAELPKTFAILLMASLVSRDLPPRHQRRASQWPTSLGRHRRGRARLVGGKAALDAAASPSQMGRFETRLGLSQNSPRPSMYVLFGAAWKWPFKNIRYVSELVLHIRGNPLTTN